ncbi:MAG: hypothetical protein AAGA58_13000 [Verrucomicrobiota bacterium]
MTIQAQVEDSTHLNLQEPLDAEAGSMVTLEIIEASERRTFTEGSSALLERAYGDDEPDYSKAGKMAAELRGLPVWENHPVSRF